MPVLRQLQTRMHRLAGAVVTVTMTETIAQCIMSVDDDGGDDITRTIRDSAQYAACSTRTFAICATWIRFRICHCAFDSRVFCDGEFIYSHGYKTPFTVAARACILRDCGGTTAPTIVEDLEPSSSRLPPNNSCICETEC